MRNKFNELSTRTLVFTMPTFVSILLIFTVGQFTLVNNISAHENTTRGKSSDTRVIFEAQDGSTISSGSVAVRPARLGEQDRRVIKSHKSRIEPVYLRDSGVPCYLCTRR